MPDDLQIALRDAQQALEHGLRKSYCAGCRCLKCRAANAQYASERAKRPNPSVDATEAREHLKALNTAGLSMRDAGKASGLSWVYLQTIKSGQRVRIRHSAHLTILSLQPVQSPGRLVNSYRTRHLIACLLGEDFTMQELAKRLGFRVRSRHSPTAKGRLTAIRRGKAEQVKRFFDYISAE